MQSARNRVSSTHLHLRLAFATDFHDKDARMSIDLIFNSDFNSENCFYDFNERLMLLPPFRI